VPIRECPHCGIRQYAQVSYVTRIECVHCGRPLDAVRQGLSKPSPVWSKKHVL
jgi:hypothetical protein